MTPASTVTHDGGTFVAAQTTGPVGSGGVNGPDAPPAGGDAYWTQIAAPGAAGAIGDATAFATFDPNEVNGYTSSDGNPTMNYGGLSGDTTAPSFTYNSAGEYTVTMYGCKASTATAGVNVAPEDLGSTFSNGGADTAMLANVSGMHSAGKDAAGYYGVTFTVNMSDVLQLGGTSAADDPFSVTMNC